MILHNLKATNRLRAYRAVYLTFMAALYAERTMQEESIGGQTSETLALTAKLIHLFTGERVLLSELVREDNATANKCLELKQRYDAYLPIGEALNMDAKLTDAIVKSVAHRPGFGMQKIYHPVYINVAHDIMKYMAGGMTEEEFLAKIKQQTEYSIPVRLDTRLLIRMMMAVQKEFYRISTLQYCRKRKKIIDEFLPSINKL